MIDPSIAIIVFFVAALVSLLSKVNRIIGDTISIFSTVFALITVIVNIYSSFEGSILLNALGVYIRINGYTSFLALVVSLIGLMVTVFSVSYIEEGIPRYQFFVLLTIGCLFGMAYSWNLLWLFIFAEICTICSAPLIAHHLDAKALEGAVKYLIIQTFSATFTLIGIGIIYKQTLEAGLAGISALNIDTLVGVLSGNVGKMGVILVFIGFAAKLPLVPIHIWLPDASTVAPAPISSLLHAMMIKIAGIPAFLILFELDYLFADAITLWLIISVLGAITMVICTSLAFAQHDLKRLLAYHSVGQIGYVILGLGIGGLGMAYFKTTGDFYWLNITAIGLTAGFFHLINHTIFKSLLFFGSGTVEFKTKIKNIDQLEGLFKTMPFTGTAMLIGSLSISGVPLFNGFVSKWMIYNACIGAVLKETSSFEGNILLNALAATNSITAIISLVLAAIAIFCSALTLASFMKVLSITFLGGPFKNEGLSDAPRSMLFPLFILSALCVIFGLIPQLAIKYLLYPATLSLVPQITRGALPKADLSISVLRFSGGLYDAYWLFTLIAIGICIGYVIYKVSPAYQGNASEEKFMPFTGGAFQDPYINIEEAMPSSSLFEHSFKPLLNALKKIHNGLVNLYVSWIAVFAILMLTCVLMGWI